MRCCGAAVPLARRDGAERGPAAVAENDLETADVVDGLAVDDGARAGRVVADHAAEVGPARGGHFRPEQEVVRRQGAVEGVEDDAGLNAGRAADGVDVEDGVEVLAAIEDDAGADRLAGQAGAAAARRDRHVHFGGDLHGRDDVFGGFGDDDAERLDLIDAGVGAVEAARGDVEADFAGEVLAQVTGQAVAAEVGEVGHGLRIVRRPSRSRQGVVAPEAF